MPIDESACAGQTSDAHKRHLPIRLVAAVALIDADGRVLIAERPEGKAFAGFWEFPGGKIETGEAPEAAVLREMTEELNIHTAPGCLAPLGFASHPYDDFHLLMPLYICRIWHGNVSPREGQKLQWTTPQKLLTYNLLPASRPLVPILMEWL